MSYRSHLFLLKLERPMLHLVKGIQCRVGYFILFLVNSYPSFAYFIVLNGTGQRDHHLSLASHHVQLFYQLKQKFMISPISVRMHIMYILFIFLLLVCLNKRLLHKRISINFSFATWTTCRLICSAHL